MKKRVFLWILLVLLLIMLFSLIILKCLYKTKSSEVVDENPTHFISYKLENYSPDEELEGTGDNNNFSFDIDEEKKEIKICILNYDECSIFSYEEQNRGYKIVSSNNEFMNGELSVLEDIDEDYGEIIKVIIKFIKYDGASNIIYFRESD